jgi:hypothetical protein
MSSATLQDDPSVESFFNVAETETLALFEHLYFEFLEEFDVFSPAQTGRTREHEQELAEAVEETTAPEGLPPVYYKAAIAILLLLLLLLIAALWLKGSKMAKDPDIKRRMDRVEKIVDQLDADEVPLEDGRNLYDEGKDAR